MVKNSSNIETFLQTLHTKVNQDGVFRFRAKIIPKAQKTEIVEILFAEEETVKLKVAAVPEKGKANQAIVRFFKKNFHLNAEILTGKTTNLKLIQIKK